MIVDRLIKDRLHEHLFHNSMFKTFQSAYTTFHSTESALLVIQDHLTEAMDRQKVTGLTLLDLSDAFDTIDHSILLHRLTSWFGMRQCSHLVPVISILQVLFCLLSKQPFLFTASILWCSPGLCSGTHSLHHVYHTAQFTH